MLHLHHAVWLINGEPTFAAGEEKTNVRLPKGFGWRYEPTDQWVLNHMIHNLLPNRDRVYITYTLDFIPDTSPAAKGIRPIETRWLDVEGGKAYPVFDVHRGSGQDGRFTYPDDVPNAYGAGFPRNQMTIQRDGVLVQTAGHLHPGGLYTDLKLTRDGRRVNLFRSRAKYWEPAGAVSWDVAMTATRPNWRVAVKRGDVLSVSATYDSKRASWYESMGIMPVAFAPGAPRRRRPVLGQARAPRRAHARPPAREPQPRRQARRAEGPAHDDRGAGQRRPARDHRLPLRPGRLLRGGAASRPPQIAPGQSLTFVNRDAAKTIYHTITACRAPCNRTTGIAYPLADGPVDFDSGELGFGPQGFTAAANRDTWSTPTTLGDGTYTYFCRVHPFMRGSFRVKG